MQPEEKRPVQSQCYCTSVSLNFRFYCMRRNSILLMMLIMLLFRAILTPIMAPATRKHITAIFHELGSDWALTSDSAKAVLRVAADKSINGGLSFSFTSNTLCIF